MPIYKMSVMPGGLHSDIVVRIYPPVLSNRHVSLDQLGGK